jgi:hypothetical protein
MHPECILEDTMFDAVITFVGEDTEGSHSVVYTRVTRVEFDSEVAFDNAMQVLATLSGVLSIEKLSAQ